MSLSRKIDIKLCPSFAKTHIYICDMVFESKFKQKIFSKFGTNLKIMITQRSLEILGKLLIWIACSICYFWIDIILLMTIFDRKVSLLSIFQGFYLAETPSGQKNHHLQTTQVKSSHLITLFILLLAAKRWLGYF